MLAFEFRSQLYGTLISPDARLIITYRGNFPDRRDYELSGNRQDLKIDSWAKKKGLLAKPNVESFQPADSSNQNCCEHPQGEGLLSVLNACYFRDTVHVVLA